jgi:hypothetical protein
MLRAAGIVALIVPLMVLAACNQPSVTAVASPSPVIPDGNWTENLKFTGALTGQMTGIVPDIAGGQVSECTGSRTHNGDQWADSFYGTVGSSGTEWGVVFLINNFRGQGTYQNSAVAVQVHSSDNSQVWQSGPADKVTFTVARNQQSGTVTAALTDANSGKAGALKLTGSWNCRG